MRSSRQVSGSHPTSHGTTEDVGASAMPEHVDLPNDLPVAEVQKEEDTDSWLCWTDGFMADFPEFTCKKDV